MISIEGYSLPLSAEPEARVTTRTGAASQLDLAALVDTYSALLFRVANSILRNPSEAEDTVQDTFLRVVQHRSTLPAVRDLRVWLVRIAWNLALDRRRRIQPGQMDDLFAQSLIAPHLPADQALADAQHIAAVLRELDRLPKLERQALLLSALEDLTTPEIAQILNRSDSAIRALLFRARTRLRTRLRTPTEKGAKS